MTCIEAVQGLGIPKEGNSSYIEYLISVNLPAGMEGRQRHIRLAHQLRELGVEVINQAAWAGLRNQPSSLGPRTFDLKLRVETEAQYKMVRRLFKNQIDKIRFVRAEFPFEQTLESAVESGQMSQQVANLLGQFARQDSGQFRLRVQKLISEQRYKDGDSYIREAEALIQSLEAHGVRTSKYEMEVWAEKGDPANGSVGQHRFEITLTEPSQVDLIYRTLSSDSNLRFELPGLMLAPSQ